MFYVRDVEIVSRSLILVHQVNDYETEYDRLDDLKSDISIGS